MPSAHIAGTFATRAQPITNPLSQQSGVLMIPTGTTSMRFNCSPLDGSNRVRLYKSTDNGITWNAQGIYISDQVNTVITVAHGEQWIATPLQMQATKVINFKMSVEA